MSYVTVAPEMMAAAATDLAGIGSALSEARIAAAPPTVALVPAAADEVSAGIAHLFSRYAEDYHALAGRATAFHEQFVQHLNASARSYAATEAANAVSLQHLNASVGSSASAIAAVPGPLLNYLTCLNAVVDQLWSRVTLAWLEFTAGYHYGPVLGLFLGLISLLNLSVALLGLLAVPFYAVELIFIC
jgi:PE family